MATITLQIYIPEIDTVIQDFDRIQVQRSKSGDPYEDAEFLTAATNEPPVVVGTEEGRFMGLSGKKLLLKVNDGVLQVLTFVTADPIHIDKVVLEINATLTGLVADSDGGKLRLTGNALGTGGSIEIIGGTSLTILGLEVGVTQGREERIPLVAGTSEYDFVDLSGEASYWYRSRVYDAVTWAFGRWSDWLQGSIGAIVPVGDLIVGQIKMIDMDGSSLAGKRVTLVNIYSPLIVDGYFTGGRSKQIETNSVGLAETTLVRGMRIDVIVEGTSIIRRITVPSTGTTFDLLDESLVEDDPFQIQVPDLPSAVRRS